MHTITKAIILLTVICIANAQIVGIVVDLIQRNLVGLPVLHKEVEYNFDPNVGIRRSRQYQEINGKYGEKAIERLGLGIDGHDQERLQQQRIRDQGHLGGLNDYLP